MRHPVLALLGVPLLLLGLLGAPVFWPLAEVLPNMGLRVLLWLAATAGVACLWLAFAPEPVGHDHRPDQGHPA